MHCWTLIGHREYMTTVHYRAADAPPVPNRFGSRSCFRPINRSDIIPSAVKQKFHSEYVHASPKWNILTLSQSPNNPLSNKNYCLENVVIWRRTWLCGREGIKNVPLFKVSSRSPNALKSLRNHSIPCVSHPFFHSSNSAVVSSPNAWGSVIKVPSIIYRPNAILHVKF